MSERTVLCDLAVRRTLSYRAVFRYPLSFFQLGTFLICEDPQPYELLVDTLDILRGEGIIRSRKEKIFLKKMRPLVWEDRARDSEKILKKHKTTFAILKKIPWIRLLAVTGATAAFNFKKGDDLDVFVITQKNRLWITRFFVVLLLKSLGVYRTDKDPGGKICPNLFISESDLAWNQKKRDVYVAHEIVMMHPIIDRGDMYFKFIKANDWVFKYFGNVHFTFPKNFHPLKSRRSVALDLVEVILMNLQKGYMKKRRTMEVTTNRLIHFNRDDSREQILAKYQRIYSKSIKNS